MIRTLALRGAWLMLGAAIGMAAAILTGGTASLFPPDVEIDGRSILLAAGGVVTVAVIVGLLPGVREIEVTAARTLLGVALEDAPTTVGLRNRWRTVAWTLLHAGTGLVTGFCVLGLLPGAVLTLVWAAAGRDDLLARTGITMSLAHPLIAGLVMLAIGVGGAVAAGWLAVRLAPVLLGPSTHDRLAVAEARLASERRHTVLARELHDGIGHALSIISIQAAAARRIFEAHPDKARTALHLIEQTSAEAQAELDHLLGLLRDPESLPRRTTRDDLATLVERHRRTGLEVELTDEHGSVPGLVWSAALDILAEALANAHRHAADRPVTVHIGHDRGNALVVRVTNPVPGRRAPQRWDGGRGILGMQERAALVDGTVTAVLSDGLWQVQASLPVPAPTTQEQS